MIAGSEAVNIDMINQANIPVKTRRCENHRLRDFGNGLHGFCVDEFEVIDGEALGSVGEQMSSCALKIDIRGLLSSDGKVSGSR